MRQIILNISENNFNAFFDFIKTLKYVEIQKSDSDIKSLQEFEHSLKQVKLMKEGKIPKQLAKDFLNEL